MSRDNLCLCLFVQAEDGIRDLVRSRGLGDVYKRQVPASPPSETMSACLPGRPRPSTLVLAMRRAA